MEERDITARVRITIRVVDDEVQFNVITKNVSSYYEELHIIQKAQVLFSTDLELFDEYENVFFEGEEPIICLAYNIENGDLRVSLNDIPDNQVLGYLEQAKHIVMKSLMGE